MTNHHLPAGCHDAESAAQLLGMSKKALLQKMREMGWLIVGGDSHNLPRRELTTRGWLTTQQRGYCLRGKKEISKSYSVMLLTQAGFNALKTELAAQKMQPTPAEAEFKTTSAEQKQGAQIAQEPEEKVIPFNRDKADAVREQTLEEINKLLAS